jgi:hypothetical protein
LTATTAKQKHRSDENHHGSVFYIAVIQAEAHDFAEGCERDCLKLSLIFFFKTS